MALFVAEESSGGVFEHSFYLFLVSLVIYLGAVILLLAIKSSFNVSSKIESNVLCSFRSLEKREMCVPEKKKNEEKKEYNCCIQRVSQKQPDFSRFRPP